MTGRPRKVGSRRRVARYGDAKPLDGAKESRPRVTIEWVCERGDPRRDPPDDGNHRTRIGQAHMDTTGDDRDPYFDHPGLLYEGPQGRRKVSGLICGFCGNNPQYSEARVTAALQALADTVGPGGHKRVRYRV